MKLLSVSVLMASVLRGVFFACVFIAIIASVILRTVKQMAKTAILKFDVPDSCAECRVSYHFKNKLTKKHDLQCVPLSMAVGKYTDRRAPFCELEIQEDENLCCSEQECGIRYSIHSNAELSRIRGYNFCPWCGRKLVDNE